MGFLYIFTFQFLVSFYIYDFIKKTTRKLTRQLPKIRSSFCHQLSSYTLLLHLCLLIVDVLPSIVLSFRDVYTSFMGFHVYLRSLLSFRNVYTSFMGRRLNPCTQSFLRNVYTSFIQIHVVTTLLCKTIFSLFYRLYAMYV